MLTKNLNPTRSSRLRSSTISLMLVASALLLISSPSVAQEPAPAPAEPAPAAPAPAPEQPTPPEQPASPQPADGVTPPATPSTPSEPPSPTAPPATPTPSEPVVAAEAVAVEASEEATSDTQPTSDASQQAKEGGSFEEQINEYWASEGRDLDTLTNRLYTKDGRFILSFFVGTEPASPFWIYLLGGLRFTYFFNEYYGMEFSGSYLYGLPNELNRYLTRELGAAYKPDIDIGDKGLFRTDLLFVWRPFYGKFGLFNKKLAHFDFNFVAGMGVYGVKRPDLTKQESSFTAEVEGVLGAGFSVFLSPEWTLRFDARGFMYRGAETASEKTYGQRLHFPAEISIGASYIF